MTMTKTKKTLEIELERIIPASPREVFAGWLDPKTPGSLWSGACAFELDVRKGGLFYWLFDETAHYGRFTKVERPKCLEHTWVSPYTLGQETLVTLTFDKEGKGTRLHLVHAELPTPASARAHREGWTYCLDEFVARAVGKSR